MEKIQRKTAPIITGDCKNRSPIGDTTTLITLNLPPLEERSKERHLTIAEWLVPVERHIRAREATDSETRAIMLSTNKRRCFNLQQGNLHLSEETHFWYVQSQTEIKRTTTKYHQGLWKASNPAYSATKCCMQLALSPSVDLRSEEVFRHTQDSYDGLGDYRT
jgi:hypothetical protein